MRLAAEVQVLKDVYDDHAGLQDRFLTCGHLAPELARSLGVVGFAARASGLALDARAGAGRVEPYDRLDVAVTTHGAGDVAARVAVRFGEIFESLRLLQTIVEGMPLGEVATHVQHRGRPRARPRPRRGLARRGRDRARGRRRRSSGAATRTTRRGRTGPRSNTRSSATSFPTSR